MGLLQVGHFTENACRDRDRTITPSATCGLAYVSQGCSIAQALKRSRHAQHTALSPNNIECVITVTCKIMHICLCFTHTLPLVSLSCCCCRRLQEVADGLGKQVLQALQNLQRSEGTCSELVREVEESREHWLAEHQYGAMLAAEVQAAHALLTAVDVQVSGSDGALDWAASAGLPQVRISGYGGGRSDRLLSGGGAGPS